MTVDTKFSTDQVLPVAASDALLVNRTYGAMENSSGPSYQYSTLYVSPNCRNGAIEHSAVMHGSTTAVMAKIASLR
ncbi:g8023 [Coccomyxa elongata]